MAVAQSRQPTFERAGEPSDDRVESPFSLHKFDDLVIEERPISPHPHFLNAMRQLGEGVLQQRDRNGRDVGVAGMIGAFPTTSPVSLEAEQGEIGRPAALLGVVAHCGMLLTAIDGQHGVVQVEDDLCRVAEHRRTPTVVQLEECVLPRTCEPLQEATQTGGFRIARQACQIMKDPVVAQRLGGLDLSETQDQRIEECLQGLADAVAVVALDKTDVSRQSPVQAEAPKKLFDQSYASKLGQADPIEGDAQISWPTVHRSKTTLLVRFWHRRQNSPSRGYRQAVCKSLQRS